MTSCLHILTNQQVVIDPVFGRTGNLSTELDLGCGKGGFTLQLAELYPHRLILGADLMLGRLRRLAKRAEHRQLRNLELLRASGLELLDRQLPPASIDRIHLLCPDPWPKARHRGKRLVTAEFMARVFRVLKEGGVFHFCSDDMVYLKAVAGLIDQLGWFTRWPAGIADLQKLQTDFERKWQTQGKPVPHLSYRRHSSR